MVPVFGDDGVHMEKVGCMYQPKPLENTEEENSYCKLSLVHAPFL